MKVLTITITNILSIWRSRSCLCYIQLGEHHRGGNNIDEEEDESPTLYFLHIHIKTVNIHQSFPNWKAFSIYSGEEQAERSWEAREIPDRVSEGHESGFQVNDPKKWEVGENRVKDQHLPTLPINPQKSQNQSRGRWERLASSNSSHRPYEHSSTQQPCHMCKDTFNFPTPPIKRQRESYCTATDILTQINLQFNSPTMSAVSLHFFYKLLDYPSDHPWACQK